MGFRQHLAGNRQKLVDELDDTSPTKRAGGRTWTGPVWVGDAAGDQAASPGCSPDLPAISLGHVWGCLSAEGQKKLSGDKPPV